MVTIVDYKSFEKENGENFFGLVVQGGIEAVKSGQTGKVYFTAKTARVATTFSEETCKTLLGTTLEGSVKKIVCDPYDYTVKETGEIMQFNHRYEFVTDEMEVLESHIMQEEFVA